MRINIMKEFSIALPNFRFIHGRESRLKEIFKYVKGGGKLF